MNMMNSLFESFDPMISLFSFNLLSISLILILPFYFYFFVKQNRNTKMFSFLNTYMTSELEASINSGNKKTKVMILNTIFISILFLNISGMFPLIYTLTSQMMFTLSLALPLWLGFLMFGFAKNTSHFFAHLVPLSTPMALSQFMVLIESISQIIRPITLSVRLCANMTAGHILMALTSSSIFMFNLVTLPLLALIILELAVAFIQSYVFSMLLSMYLSENL